MTKLLRRAHQADEFVLYKVVGEMFRLEANSTKEQSAPDGTCNKLERPALTCLAQKPDQPPDEPVADALVRARWILSTIRPAIFKLQDCFSLNPNPDRNASN